MARVIDRASVPDAEAFLGRLLRLDPGAVVRLRPVADGALALWARLPFAVLVNRGVRGSLHEVSDVTVAAADLIRVLDGPLPPARDADWRWPLPPVPGRVVDRLAAADVARVVDAAAATVRAAATEGVDGRAVGERALRDALLDHVPVVVTTDAGERVAVPQRMIQAVARMGFVGERPVEVRVAGPWVGLAAAYGAAWYRPDKGFRVVPRRVTSVDVHPSNRTVER
jgi:hypothetical protein